MRYVDTNKGKVSVRKYNFGWGVSYGPYQGIGSYGKLVDLIAAINAV